MGMSFNEQDNVFVAILGDGDIMQSAGTANSVRGDEPPQRLFMWTMLALAEPVGVGSPLPADPELADAPGLSIGVRTAEDARIFAKRMAEFADWIERQESGVVS